MNPVELQLQAYNDKDIDLFMSCYDESVQVFAFPNTLKIATHAEMRAHYKKLFETYPNMNADVVKRIQQGKYVIDHEYITGRQEEPFHATALYEVKEDKIMKVWFL